MLAKALVLKIEFFEAHFKVHYTKGFRLTYPIPLPTSVAGIFARLLNIPREETMKRFKGCRFGAILADGTAKKKLTLYNMERILEVSHWYIWIGYAGYSGQF